MIIVTVDQSVLKLCLLYSGLGQSKIYFTVERVKKSNKTGRNRNCHKHKIFLDY